MPAVSRNWKKQGVDSSLGPLKGVWPYQHLDFGPGVLILDLWPPETVREYITGIVGHQVYAIFFYSNHGK